MDTPRDCVRLKLGNSAQQHSASQNWHKESLKRIGMLSRGWQYRGSLAPCPTELCLQCPLPGTYFGWKNTEQSRRQAKAGPHCPRSTQPHARAKRSRAHKRSFQPLKSGSSPEVFPSLLGHGHKRCPKLVMPARVRSRQERRRAVLQDKGRQPKGAFAQLDHRSECQNSLFPAQVTAQHFHGKQGMQDEARAAPGRHPGSPLRGFMSQQGQELEPGIAAAQLSTHAPNLSWQKPEHAGSSAALGFPATAPAFPH